ncbi:MAG TPA: 1,4-dihydroxy-2-naphthoate polyprenyltransferase [Polyangiaceae bacterium]|jgi:1,4-dihydroxy-2-naphthoate octaprenyltransferase|nr:1,4-dihydroxy-2-naphthoate polyprenyltransferase [Polyangiaceae bacterium]
MSASTAASPAGAAQSAVPLPARPGSLKAWVLAARPATLTAAVAPVLVGSACAFDAGVFRAGPALGALLGAMLLQIGANFANDVFDYEKGADTAERLGPVRAVQAGLLSAGAVRRGMLVVFGLSLLVGVYLILQAGPAILAVGLLSIACAVAYTGGPYPLGYHGLGDLFVFIFFGLVAVCGSAFVHARSLTSLAPLAAIPPGALATAILVVNNLRDRETDVKAGKRTLAVRFGRGGALAEYFALFFAAYAIPVLFALLKLSGPWVLLPWLSAPLAIRLLVRVSRTQGRALNPLLVATARLLFLFGVLFALGIALGAHPA